MQSQESEILPTKLLAARTAKLKLIAACVITLAVGLAFAPPRRPTALGAPQERAAPLLESQVQAPPPRRTIDDARTVVERVNQFPFAIRSKPRELPALIADFAASLTLPATPAFAVRLSATHALTHVGALDGHPSVELAAPGGATIQARVSVFDPHTGIVLLEIPAGPDQSPVVTGSPVDAGELLVAIAAHEGRERVVPVFAISVGPDRLDLGGATAALRPGMPLYDLEGALVAIAVGESTTRAVPIAAAVARTIDRVSTGERLGAIGLTFQALNGEVADVFGTSGALISDVLADGPAAAAGMVPGDVLLAVNDTAIATAEEAARVLQALVPGATPSLRLRRRGREMTTTARAESAYEAASRARLIESTAPSQPEARTLFDEAMLDAARIPPKAHILSVNGKRLSTRAQVAREMRVARGPVPVRAQVGPSAFFAVVGAGR